MKKLINISLSGLGCEHCVDTVNKTLSNIDGIYRVNTSLDDSSVEVEYDDSLLNFDDIKSAIENAGYNVI